MVRRLPIAGDPAMASVVFYFQVHQPFRLRKYSVFDEAPLYFADDENRRICEKVAEKCYRPATTLIRDLVKRQDGRFKVAYSITGTALEQLQAWAPDVVDLLKELVETGHCELLGETFHHSLAFLYSRGEFWEQVDEHEAIIRDTFGVTPRVFRNTELIFNNDLAREIGAAKREDGSFRYDGLCCEGVDWILHGRSPNYLYSTPGGVMGRDEPFSLLLKNHRLSDDMAFRFGNRAWPEWPLTADKFARWINAINGDGYLCNLFMDYETFGEHQWADTGIFEFLEALPTAVLNANPGHNDFTTPSEALASHEPVGEYDAPHYTSWADTERDLSAWLGNAMQSSALHEIFKLEKDVKKQVKRLAAERDPQSEKLARDLLGDWRKLTTSDHFYYMCTKFFADGDVHTYFNPYDSPYDSYINFMNVLDNLRERLREPAPA
jgi:alpha-amylase